MYAKRMFASVLLVLGGFSFDGGSPSEFVRAVSGITTEQIIFVADSDAKLGSVRVTYQNNEAAVAKIADAMSLHASTDGDFVFWSHGFPTWTMMPNSSFVVDRPRASGTLQASNGRLNCGNPVPALMYGGDFESAHLSKPLHMHWFYKNMPIFIRANNAREPFLLRSLAAALGADFTETPKEYRFDFSPAEFRRRSVATFERLGKLDRFPIKSQDAAFDVAALNAATDEDLTKAYETPTSQRQIPMPVSEKLHSLALDRMQREFHDLLASDRLSESNKANVEWIRKNVDFTKSGYVLLSAMTAPQASFPCTDGPNHWFQF